MNKSLKVLKIRTINQHKSTIIYYNHYKPPLIPINHPPFFVAGFAISAPAAGRWWSPPPLQLWISLGRSPPSAPRPWRTGTRVRGERGADVFKDSLHLPVTYGGLCFFAGRCFFLVDDEWYF